MNNRWHLVLGVKEENSEVQLSGEDKQIEELLKATYGEGSHGGFGRSNHKVRKWLNGIRQHFSPEVVRIMQKDALERQNAKEMLLEPELLELIEPDVNLVATILSLQYLLPDNTKAVARELVEKLVKKIEKTLRTKLVHAIREGISGQSKLVHPLGSTIDWKKTISKNIKNYESEIKSIIPTRWYGFKNGSRLKEVYLLIDKSESMINSAIHASIIGSILASINSIRTHLIFFDTEICDLTGKYHDPIDILFSVPMGGGTDIGLALAYVDQKMKKHSDCILFLISDLDEGASKALMFQSIESLISKGTHIQCILSMDDNGTSEYNQKIAEEISSLKIPVYSTSPDNFPKILCAELAKY